MTTAKIVETLQQLEERLKDVEKFQAKLEEWITWGLKIILLAILTALLSLVIKSAT